MKPDLDGTEPAKEGTPALASSLLYEDILYFTTAGGPAPPRPLSTEEWGARCASVLLLSGPITALEVAK